MIKRSVLVMAAFVFVVLPGWAISQTVIIPPDRSAPDALASRDLEARRGQVRGVRTRSEAEGRQARVRETMLRLIGPLPEKGSLNDRILGETILPGFRIQKIVFDSQPGFHVTALLYLPNSTLVERYPAIVMAPDHSTVGKASDFAVAAAFARNGFAVLSYDPIGEGERLQYPDPENAGRSLAGGPAGEHAEAGLQPLLIGESVAKYFLWDGMRAVDFLESRSEIDGSRIGAYGCGSGGAMAALLGALDTRIAAVGTACYLSGFDALLTKDVMLDGEQGAANWVKAGLDFADWVELAAPRPYAIIATQAGTAATEKEARDFYKLFDADTKLAYITAPGGPSDLRVIMPRILEFFINSLQPQPFPPVYDDESAAMQPRLEAFQVTSTGQVSTSYFGAETVFTLNMQEARALSPARPKDFGELQRAIREVTAAEVEPVKVRRDVPVPKAVAQESGEPMLCGVHLEKPYASDGLWVEGKVSPVKEGAKFSSWQVMVWGPRGGLIGFTLVVPHRAETCSLALMIPSLMETSYAEGQAELERLVASGHIVALMNPQQRAGEKPAFAGGPLPPLLGYYYLTGVRDQLVGRTILGYRIDDAIEAANYLSRIVLPHKQGIFAEGWGHTALVLLHAAVLDPQLTRVEVHNIPRSYAGILADPMPKDVAEDIAPGVLLRYDVPDLIEALGDRLGGAEPSGAQGSGR